eukprot:1156713-Pelagomonas_calceolata.AAC.1
MSGMAQLNQWSNGCDLEQVGGEAMETVFSDLVIHQRKKGNWWQCESGPENSSSYCSSFSPYNGISDSSSTKVQFGFVSTCHDEC